MAKKRRHLGEILYKSKLVDKPTLIKAIKKGRADNTRLGETLVKMGIVSEDIISKALAKQFGMEYVDLDETPISQSAQKLIPPELVKKHFVLPLGLDNGRLKIIISDPLDLDLQDLLRFRLNKELECCLASPSKIRTFILHTMDEVRSSIDATAAELEAAGVARFERLNERGRPLVMTPVAGGAARGNRA